MRLVVRPQQFDVIVLPNLYGDIISDFAPGSSAGWVSLPAQYQRRRAVFEATHGSAPKHAATRLTPWR